MSDPSSGGGGGGGGDVFNQISLSGALSSSYERDQEGFANLLALLLEGSLTPGTLAVERKPVRLFSSEKRVTMITVTLGGEIYRLVDAVRGRPLQAQIETVVRGVKLKTESVDVAAWLERLAAALTIRTQGSERSAEAIAAFLRTQGL